MDLCPTARPPTKISGTAMEKTEKVPNCAGILGGRFSKRSQDDTFEDLQKEIHGRQTAFRAISIAASGRDISQRSVRNDHVSGDRTTGLWL
jgi:hypothetical protein